MRRILPRSFFWQLVVATTAVQTLFLGLFVWYTIVSQRKAAAARTRDRISQQLQLVSSASAYEIEHADRGSLQNILELSQVSPSIEAARLTDIQGNTIAVTARGQGRGLDPYEIAALPKALHQQQIFTIRNGQIEAVSPVQRNGQPVALLWLEPNHSSAATTISMVVRVALSYGGFALLANLLPLFIVVRSMTQPLRELQRATANVVRDPAHTSGFPLPITATNEAGELTASFNAMVQELETQRSGLLETLALLDSMLRNAPIGLAFLDPDLHYVRVNEALAAMHGVPVERHEGRTPAEFYPETIGTAKTELVRRVFATGEPIRNVELSDADDQPAESQRTWLMHFYPIRTGGDAVKRVGIIVMEITDRLRAEEALRKTEKLAATGRLAASIAHEINNPLEAVTNILYLLSTTDGMTTEAADLVHTAQAELARVSHITQQTLRFHRQSSFPTRTSIEEIIDSLLLLYRSRLVAGQFTLETRLRGDTRVLGLSGELRQLFANLLSNAFDALPAGGRLSIRARRCFGRGSDDTWVSGVSIVFADNGVGMSPATRERIFEAFFTTKEATGTGLGLWVSDEIVRKHAGRIQVRSREGQVHGTIFRIFLPDNGIRPHGLPPDVLVPPGGSATTFGA